MFPFSFVSDLEPSIGSGQQGTYLRHCGRWFNWLEILKNENKNKVKKRNRSGKIRKKAAKEVGVIGKVSKYAGPQGPALVPP